MSFQKLLSLTAACMLAIILIYLGIAMYLDVKADIADLMYVTDSTRLNGISMEINTAVNDIITTCIYLQQNERLMQNLEICRDKQAPLYDRSVASGQIQNFIALALNNHTLLSDVIIDTGDNQFKIGSFSGEYYRLELDGTADSAIAMHYMPGCNFYQEQIYPKTLSMSQLVYYSFTVGGDGEDASRVYLILNPDFLRQLTADNAHILVFNEQDRCIYWDEETYTPEFLAGFALGADDAKESGDTMVYRSQIDNGWTVLYLQQTSAYTQQYLVILFFCLLAFIICLLASLMLARVLSTRVLNPVHRLVGRMKRYKLPETEGAEQADLAGEDPGPEEPEPGRRLADLRESLFLFLIMTVLLPAAGFTLFFNFTAARVMARQTERSYQTATQNIAQTLSSFFERKEKAVSRIAYDNATISYLENRSEEDYGLSDIIRENIFFGIDDDAMDVYDADGKLIFANNMVADETIQTDGIARKPSWDVGKDVFNRIRFRLISPIARFNVARNLGYLQLSMQYDTLNDLLGGVTAKPVSMADADGRVLGAEKQLGFTFSDTASVQRIQRGELIYSAQRVGNTPWYVFLQYQEPNFAMYNDRVFSDNAEFIIIAVLVIVLITYALSHMLLRPLGLAHRAMLHLEPGNPEVRMEEDSTIDEVSDIEHSFNRMADRIDGLIDNLVLSNRMKVQLESEKKDAEIIALQMQINPHFLSNTIDTISNIVIEGEADKARDMLHALNNLFRYGISKPDYLITVREEIEYARAYADIMSVRYASIEFRWDIEESALNCRTIKLILQPVIENAIYHGVRGMERMGIIGISSFVEGDFVYFMVGDNGAGMEPERLDGLRRDLADARLGSLIGILNVQARLRLHFGEEYGLEVQSEKGQGTRVLIRLPREESRGYQAQ